MGGETRSVTLQTPIGFGNCTEQRRTDSGGQAKALALLENKIPAAQALGPPGIHVLRRVRTIKRQRAEAGYTGDWPGMLEDGVRSTEVGGKEKLHVHKDCPLFGKMTAPIGGNGKKSRSAFEREHLDLEIVPPITCDQAVELMNYYYLVWLAKKNPGDEQLSMKVKTYGAKYIDALIYAKEEVIGDAKRAADFLSHAKKEAFRHAQDMISFRLEIEQKIAELELDKKEALAMLETQETEKVSAISEVYARKDARLAKRIERQHEPNALFEKAKKLAQKLGLGKIGIGLGTAISGFGTAFKAFKNFIHDITEHIPIVSGVPPELVGLGLVGAALSVWLAAKGIASALTWHFEVIRGSLPAREAKKKANAMDEFAELKEDAKRTFEQARKYLLEQCQVRHKEIEQHYLQIFDRLLVSHGYVSPN